MTQLISQTKVLEEAEEVRDVGETGATEPEHGHRRKAGRNHRKVQRERQDDHHIFKKLKDLMMMIIFA